MSNCEAVTFPLVSWVRCGALLYHFLILVLFLTFKNVGHCDVYFIVFALYMLDCLRTYNHYMICIMSQYMSVSFDLSLVFRQRMLFLNKYTSVAGCS